MEVASLLGTPGKRTVVIVAHPSLRDPVRSWMAEFARDRVVVLAPDEAAEWDLAGAGVEFGIAATFGELTRELKKVGAIDVVVTLLPTELLPGTDSDQLSLFSRIFRFLKPGGAYLLDRAVVPTSSEVLGQERWFEMLASSEEPKRSGQAGARKTDLGTAVGTVITSRDFVLVTKRVKDYLILREGDIDPILSAREPGTQLRILDRRAGGEFDVRANLTIHGRSPVPQPWSDRIAYPELTLRHYRGDLASSGATLLFTGSTILPDSFRWHLSERPRNPRVTSSGKEFGRIPSRFVPQQHLAGNFYSLDNTYSGHFGHLLTEVVSRLWGWRRAKDEIEDLKALIHMKHRSGKDPKLEREIFTAFGIDPSDLVWVNKPVYVDSVVSASPMWHMENPHTVHPDLTDTWHRLTDGLLRGARPSGTPERIFVSRGEGLHRACRNSAEVESIFADRGFEVIYPETLPLRRQAELFAGAKVVAGFGGSAMFNVMHATQLEHTIVLTHGAYTARNEHLYAALLGGELTYFYSEPDTPQTADASSKDTFFGDWDFDFAQHRDTLVALLDGL